jgi:hypothetical protein
MSSVNINLHRVVEIIIEGTVELEAEREGKDHVFYTRDIVIVQDDGTELEIGMFADEPTKLIPAFVMDDNSEED